MFSQTLLLTEAGFRPVKQWKKETNLQDTQPTSLQMTCCDTISGCHLLAATIQYCPELLWCEPSVMGSPYLSL